MLQYMRWLLSITSVHITTEVVQLCEAVQNYLNLVTDQLKLIVVIHYESGLNSFAFNNFCSK